jgi:hypothetical protein
MKKGLLITIALLMAAAFFPASVEAKSPNYVLFTACLDTDGTYKLTIEIVAPHVFLADFNGAPNGVTGYQARVRRDGGPWVTYEYGSYGLTLKMGGLPKGTKVDVELMDLFTLTELGEGILVIPNLFSITLQGPDIPPCFQKCDGTPLFKMFLLTRPDSYCLLVSDVHPSVESQKALCFPGKDWVATNTVCEGWVCNNGCWDCDYLGFERIGFDDLMKIYERRMGLLQ